MAATNYPSGDGDLFVAKFDIAQVGAASLIYLVRIGAGNFSYCKSHGIAVDDAGNAYVTGSVQMSFGPSLFPVTPGAFDTTYGTGDEGAIGYLLKLGNTLPVSLVYATYLGPGEANSVATFGGDAFVIGTTFNTTFPTTADALQPTYGGSNTDAFALRMNATGTTLVYSTFLGGDGQDQGTDIVVNDAGEAIATGISRGGFPTSAGGFQPVHAGQFTNDIFLVQINSNGTDYGCGGSTYVGGTQDEYYGSFYDFYAPSIALLNVGGQDIVSVVATSHSEDFPTTPGVYEENKVNGIADQPVFFKMSCAGTALVPEAGFNSDAAPTCTGGLVDFEDTSLFGATSWNWSFPGGIPATSTTADPQDINYTAPGTYDVTLVACNAVGCDTITQQITLVAQPLPTVSLGNDTAFCAGGSVMIEAATGFASYTWQADGVLLPNTTASIAVDEAGVYTVLVEDGAGCAAADTVEVLLLSTPIAAFSYEVRSIPCGPEEVLFQALAGASTYAWDFGDSTSATGPAQTHNYIVNGTYAVLLTVSNGPCSDSIVLPVVVDGGNASAGPIVIPNIFSPNGDGVNDRFAPSGLADFPECFDLEVYDRWGTVMFRSSATIASWDGKAGNGELALDGVYYYLLTLDSTEYVGNVQLLR